MRSGQAMKNNLRSCCTASTARGIMLFMAPILDDIRKAIDASDKSRYRIAKDTGISESHLGQLMAGTKGLSIDALELLADYLGLEIVTQPKPRKKGK